MNNFLYPALMGLKCHLKHHKLLTYMTGAGQSYKQY